MKSFDYVIKASVGIHARPATLLTCLAANYQSHITIKRGNKEANVKNIMELMVLCVLCGDAVTFSINGPDEAEAYDALKVFCEKNL